MDSVNEPGGGASGINWQLPQKYKFDFLDRDLRDRRQCISVDMNTLPEPAPMTTTLIGRSSSHFTRITRIFAAELSIEYSFSIVRDLSSADTSVYAGNPALKIPVMQNSRGTWFGALPICREFQRESSRTLKVIWPEDLTDSITSNAQELVLHAMTAGVNLIMNKMAQGTSSAHPKIDASLDNALLWLEEHLPATLKSLPPRDLSFLETSLYCLATHLEFRQIRDIRNHHNLIQFCEQFSIRASSKATAFKFDT